MLKSLKTLAFNSCGFTGPAVDRTDRFRYFPAPAREFNEGYDAKAFARPCSARKHDRFRPAFQEAGRTGRNGKRDDRD
ncbi:hypothetical protein, partial [Agrobacterium cavarae]|uniref:hypothetical protein n=1 Tax=Agrobacterium cavarae TaxID=2528239 RepID=UPI0028A5BF7F